MADSNLNYEWKLTGLKKTSGNNLSDVVVQTYWTLTGTDSDGDSGTFSGATPFDLNKVDPASFTSYESLTEGIILSWVQDVVVGSYKDHVDQQIQKQIDAKKTPVVEVKEGDFPWS